MDIADYANSAPSSSRLGRLDQYLEAATLPPAPIDQYWQSVSSILRYGTEERLSSTRFLGRLLLLGIVSASEGYVRGILAGCLEQCPHCRSHASKQQVHLGGLLWHGQSGFSRSAFEHSSFCSKDEIKSAYNKYLNVDLKDSNFQSILAEYENVCQLRHGIVHVDGLLPGRNAVTLDIPSYDGPVKISIGFAELQSAADVVTTLIYTLNRMMFEEMLRRWATTWRTRADWQPVKESKQFDALWRLFVSGEIVGNNVASSKRQCRAKLRSIYNI
jgi:hypothetical protein